MLKSWHHLRHHLVFIPGILLLSALSVRPAESDEDIRWQDAALEVDNLPFSKAFIDSIKKHNNITPYSSPLRVVPKKIPCVPETLVYDVSWGPFKAGYVVLTVEPDKESNTIRLGGKALSNNFISAFYKMRDYVISTVCADGLYPLFFEQHLREGKKYKADRYAVFDHVAGKLHAKERKFNSLEAPQFIHDYLSILYYIRTQEIAPGDTFWLDLYIHSKVHPIFFKAKGRKKVEVDAGTFNSIIIEPKLVGEGGAFNRKDKMEVWVSDDKYKMPLLIRSKIKVGAVSAKLIWHSNKRLQSNQSSG